MTISPRMLGDRYELGAVVGRGGTADVFAAYDHVLQRDVAVKLLREATEVDRARFASEIRLMRMLEHPHVVRMLDTSTGGDRPWLVMELVEGVPLDVVMSNMPIEAARAAAIGGQVAGALAHAHAHGIVHRDVKPSNVLLAAGDCAKLTDFGIARRTDSASVTLTGHTIGTAAYLAPEQVAGEAVSEAADIYALGLVLLEAVTGRREYEGPPVEAALARLQRAPAVPVSLPPGWSALISAMTAMVPAERPAASEVVSRLNALAAGSAAVGASATQATALFALGRERLAEQPVTSDGRRSRKALAAICSAAATFVLAVTLLVAGGPDDQPASASETAAPATTMPSPRAPVRTPTPSPTAPSVATTAAAATTTPSSRPATKRPAPRRQTGARQESVRNKKAEAPRTKGKQSGSKRGKASKGRR